MKLQHSFAVFLLLILCGCISGIDNGQSRKPEPPTPIVSPTTGVLSSAIRNAMREQTDAIRAFCSDAKSKAEANIDDYETRGKSYNAACDRIAKETAEKISFAIKAFRQSPGFTEAEMWRQMHDGYGN